LTFSLLSVITKLTKNKREKIKEVQSTRNVTKYLIEYERQEVRTTRNLTIYPKEF